MRTYMLLDASSSMVSRWTEVLLSIDQYVANLSQDEEVQVSPIKLCTFSSPGSSMDFNIVADSPVEKWKPISKSAVYPYGMTPLYDAIGRIIAIAEADNPSRAVILILTDGEENGSREMTKDRARVVLDRARARGWQVIFMGADFDAMKQGASLGANVGHTLNVSTRNLSSMMARTATMSSSYAVGGQSVAYTMEDRESAEA